MYLTVPWIWLNYFIDLNEVSPLRYSFILHPSLIEPPRHLTIYNYTLFITQKSGYQFNSFEMTKNHVATKFADFLQGQK